MSFIANLSPELVLAAPGANTTTQPAPNPTTGPYSRLKAINPTRAALEKATQGTAFSFKVNIISGVNLNKLMLDESVPNAQVRGAFRVNPEAPLKTMENLGIVTDIKYRFKSPQFGYQKVIRIENICNFVK